MEKDFVDYLDKKFNSIDKKFDDVDGRFNQMNEKFNEVLDGQDGIVKQLSDLEQESQMSTRLYKKHDKKIENHEERILALKVKS